MLGYEEEQQSIEIKQFIVNGQNRAEQKFNHFYPDVFWVSDVGYRQFLTEINSVITEQERTEKLNPRFYEVFVETVLFCQMVRRHNQHDYLTTIDLKNSLDWLSRILNSFIHL